MRKILLVIMLAALLGPAAASDQCQIRTGVPFASDFDSLPTNYNRATDRLATAGALTSDDITQLWDMGFDMVVDVRPAEPEVIAAERELVEARGLAYHHLPYTDDGVSDADLAAFNALVADPKEWRILLHCKKGNRAGAFLASHYLSLAVERDYALAAGRAAGMMPEMEAGLVARIDAE